MVREKLSTGVVAAMAGLLMTGFVGQAHAATVTYTYDFTGDPTGSTYFTSRTFTSVADGDEDPTLTVTGLTYNNGTTNTSSANASVGQWENLGLGLKSYNDDSHTVDSSGTKNDLLKLAFSQEVTLVSATFTYAGYLLHSVGGFAYFVDDETSVESGYGSLNGDKIFDHAEMEDYDAGDHTGSYSFRDNGFADLSKTFGIGAIWSLLHSTEVCEYKGWPRKRKVCHTESYTLFDSFKLASVTVSQYVPDPNDGGPVVPLPAGFVLLLSGLTGMGFFGRLKNKLSKAAA